MTFSRSQLCGLLLSLALSAVAISARDLKSINGPCLLPATPDSLPAQPGPFDTQTGPGVLKYYCFGYQFISTHEPTPVITVIKTDWFRNIGNPHVNPFFYLQSADEDAVLEDVSANSVYYYPLDGAFGSGANGTGYGGEPYKVSSTSGKYVYTVVYQAASDVDGVTTKGINRALRNLGKRIQRFFPARGASKRRPGVTDFEITTFFARQDPKINGPDSAKYNITIDGDVTPDRRVRGCQYV